MRFRFAFSALALVSLIPLGATLGQDKKKVTIGFVPSLLADLNSGQKKVVDDEFPVLVRDFTGLDGQIEKVGSVKELADKVVAGTTQFGVFQGIEFAEAQAQNPELKALLLSIYRTPQIKVLVVAKNDSAVASFADLKDKDVTVLKEGKEHIKRFVQKKTGGDPAKYFGKVVTPANSEAALNSVLQNKVQAAVVDTGSLELYRKVFPGGFARLKVVAESEIFPPSVIAYNPKEVGGDIVAKFKDGMIGSNKTAKGRDVLSTFKITEFEAVPPDFDGVLAAIRKAYPQ